MNFGSTGDSDKGIPKASDKQLNFIQNMANFLWQHESLSQEVYEEILSEMREMNIKQASKWIEYLKDDYYTVKNTQDEDW